MTSSDQFFHIKDLIKLLGENDNNKINKLLENYENYFLISEKYKLNSDFDILKQLPLDQYQKPGLKLITK
jgi:L-arabinose isomerase